MSKLFKLKEWLTISDAARHLSIVLGEVVADADVLRLALDGHLGISVHFVNRAYARRCIQIHPDGILYETMTSINGETTVKVPKYGRVWGDWRGIFQVDHYMVIELEGVWDIPINDGGRLDVEYQYHALTGGPEFKMLILDGVLVEDNKGGLYEIQSSFEDNVDFNGELKSPYNHHDNFYPAGGLPSDSVLVVRTEALRKFENMIADEPPNIEKALSTTERNTLLVMIAALCKKSNIEPQSRTAASEIERLADGIGVKVTNETVRKVLDKIPNAISARSK